MPVTVGIPCSNLPYKSDVPVTSEAEALAFAAGVAIVTRKIPRVFMQNAGLGRSIDVIASLLIPYEIKVEIIISDRKEPEQHKVMGRITEYLLDLIDYEKARCYKKYHVGNYGRGGYHICGDGLKRDLRHRRPHA